MICIRFGGFLSSRINKGFEGIFYKNVYAVYGVYALWIYPYIESIYN